MRKHTAHRIGEGKYSYRGWTIVFDEETKRWLPINPDDECDWSCETLREAKHDIDNIYERG